MAAHKKRLSPLTHIAGNFLRYTHVSITVISLVFFFIVAVWSVIRFADRMSLEIHPARHAAQGAIKGEAYAETAISIDRSLLSPAATRFLGFATDRLGTSVESVLGASTDSVSPLGKWQDIRQNDERLYEGWKNKTHQYPLFADVYFRAAYYAIRLGKYADAKTFIDNGARLSPTSDIASALKAHIPR